mmetsp:Transcript_23179/g.22659  ORF Transcript_23179/g.22659 Transcript_23179/m.22659 type:complete len:230 (-) Transcript_23179:2589-3278(-)
MEEDNSVRVQAPSIANRGEFAEEDLEDDVDEGSIDINSLELKRPMNKHSASKKIMTQRMASSGPNHVHSILEIIQEEKGVDQLQVVSHGLKILVINDNMFNFFPVLEIVLSELSFSCDQNETQRAGQTSFSSMINFYNAEASEWEPFVETFKVFFSINDDQQSKRHILQCEVPNQLSLNITETLISNLNDTYKSWQAISNEEDEEKPFKSEAKPYQQEEPLFSDRGGTK